MQINARSFLSHIANEKSYVSLRYTATCQFWKFFQVALAYFIKDRSILREFWNIPGSVNPTVHSQGLF